MSFYIGTSGWSYENWQETFYPANLKRWEWFGYYQKKFSTAELKATFHRTLPKTTFKNWYRKTSENFLFSLKMNQEITHKEKLAKPLETLPPFFKQVEGLEEKCGPILIQLPHDLKFEEEKVRNFIEELKTYPYKFTIEPRHKSWFQDNVYNLLEKYNIALTIAESPSFPSAQKITSEDFVYVRLHGKNSLYSSSYNREELKRWAGRLKRWEKSGRDVYVYFNNNENANAPHNALQLKRILDEWQ